MLMTDCYDMMKALPVGITSTGHGHNAQASGFTRTSVGGPQGESGFMKCSSSRHEFVITLFP